MHTTCLNIKTAAFSHTEIFLCFSVNSNFSCVELIDWSILGKLSVFNMQQELSYETFNNLLEIHSFKTWHPRCVSEIHNNISYTPSLLQISPISIPSFTCYYRWNTQFNRSKEETPYLFITSAPTIARTRGLILPTQNNNLFRRFLY